ncbi:NAD(P)H-binding protein [Rugosimonospora africana]|uniref:Nucleotide-diphosphate-sugar epimerase n=1 Tax=Rugosimonospora africana TaxID=556532 RepID=A0A8J3QVS4_9ACTN|nr:NAD(P)H-binding protein [Rugosimonospora africana]GIH15681.1 nucleotide-diphosphate-sugar epimerase [Rugosimonospora africana]
MILITGATGNVGREAITQLLDERLSVMAVSREPSTSALPGGAEVVRADPSRPRTLEAALDGVEAILLSPRAAGGAVAELLALAGRQGVKRVVLLSAVTVQYPAGYQRFADEFRAVEQIVRDSGLDWTILRCADFASNTLAWAGQIRSTGTIRGAYPNAASSTIHERDIAAVAVRALTDPVHGGQAYALTGPQSLSQLDKVRAIGRAIGEDLSFVELPADQVRQGMLAAGLPEDVPDRLLGSLADYAFTPGPSTDTVQRLLGRPALTFASWAAEHAAAFLG